MQNLESPGSLLQWLGIEKDGGCQDWALIFKKYFFSGIGVIVLTQLIELKTTLFLVMVFSIPPTHAPLF